MPTRPPLQGKSSMGARKHTPTLSPHLEDTPAGDDAWNDMGRWQQSLPSSSQPSFPRARFKLRSSSSYSSEISSGSSQASSVPDTNSNPPKPPQKRYSEKYYQLFKKYQNPSSVEQEDMEKLHFQRPLGHSTDGGETDDEDADITYVAARTATLADDLELDGAAELGQRDMERLEWQAMLSSVLSGEVLRTEKTRIARALESSEAHRNRLDIWYGLRAFAHRKTVESERQYLEEGRLRTVKPIVDEILNFRVISPDDPDAADTPPPPPIQQITGVLNRLDYAQSLYPSLQDMESEHPACTEKEFTSRRDVLVSWVNVANSLRYQIDSLKTWTGSDKLDVTEPNTTAEVPIQKSKPAPEEHADSTTFVERIIKDSLQGTFEKGGLAKIHAPVRSAKLLLILYGDRFDELNLPKFEDELVLLISFPTRLMEALLRVRLEYALKLKEPNLLTIDQMLDDFRTSIGFACALKAEYEDFMASDAEGYWDLPPSISPTYDTVIIESLQFFFKLIDWKLKGGDKEVSLKETELLEMEWGLMCDVALMTEKGAAVVAEQLCGITNRLTVRVVNLFETQMKTPKYVPSQRTLLERASGKDTRKENSVEGTVRYFGNVLEDVRPRFRKLQRFSRLIMQRFTNSAEYSLDSMDIDPFIEALVATDHFLVYTNTYEEEGVYIIGHPLLKDRTDKVIRMLQQSFDVNDMADPEEESISGEENAPSYLLLLSPTDRFLWRGEVVMMDVPKVEFELRDRRVRLIANGSRDRLAESKLLFAEVFLRDERADTVDDDGDDDEDNDDDREEEEMSTPMGPLACVIEQQAHLPTVNRELRRILRTSNKVSEAIVESLHQVRQAANGVQGTQELVENWFVFASELAQRLVDKALSPKVDRLLTRLAISWVAFICDDCDPTDSKTFRWAINALEFAMIRTRGKYILQLSESDFSLLRQKVASCVTLLVSHFDILGARSSLEAKKEKERLAEMRQEQSATDEFFLFNHRPAPPNLSPGPTRDRFFQEKEEEEQTRPTFWKLRELDQRREEIELAEQRIGRVLDTEKPEDRSLLSLAASRSRVAIRWQQGRFIGGGAFGSVYLAVNLDSGELMAVKEIRFKDASSLSNLSKQIRDELNVMSMLHHPNIVEYYGIEVHRDKVFIFEEYCQGGSLSGLLEHGRIEDESVVQVYTLQMLEGLAYLHKASVVHRDVKPDNILLDHMGVIKFVDFGAAKVLAAKTRGSVQRSRVPIPSMTGVVPGMLGMMDNSLTGTPMYMSPEMIKNDQRGRHGAMDIWSLGCVVLECVTGRKPWRNLDNEWAIMFHIGVATNHPPLPEPGQLSEVGISFIKACLTIDPMVRPSAEELFEHPWMISIREGMIEYENETMMSDMPSTPGTGSAALPMDWFEGSAKQEDEEAYFRSSTSERSYN
ncbi:hypothetical protein BOTBODRAFT_307461 [Botryobasidium botryosum FD-172 SS1]|uniref:Protein kinase domain-containing protein n=1 Tax=Botryobasidium botryosum (strain FD-172 SS1) TaxID=930990 RepID=A0A067MXH5_BOTB1|nr:hypothetical protein BOTBODRAFT_307461 [Botryobasidium botryosum FD-172 SS1]